MLKTPTYEVLSKGEVTGPLLRTDIFGGVRHYRFDPEGFYRKQGAPDWRPIRQLLRNERTTRVTLYIFCSLYFIVCAVFVIESGLQIVRIARATSAWPSTSGKITYAAVEKSGDQYLRYLPRVYYSYRVGRRWFIGSIIYPGCGIGTKEWAQSLIDKHPAGTVCTVFYNPTRAQFGVLEPGLRPHSFQFTAAGFVVAYIGALVGFIGYKTWKGNEIPARVPPRIFYLRFAAGFIPAIIGLTVAFWLP
jgi:hypothetical protein